MTMARYGYDQAPPNGMVPAYPPGYLPAPAPTPPPADVDSWATVLVSISQLAEQICNTEFVPAAMRNNPAAVTAAILTGRELGIGPMTSLAHIHIVKGKPGQSAQLMRQLVLSAGHQIRYVETTDSRCIVEGKRRGEDQWERVSFTADQARKAKIVLGDYPEDKLVARATSRLCRRKFSDCIGGMPYTVEELEEGFVDHDDDAPTQQAAVGEQPTPAAQQRRTAQRRTRKTAEPKAATAVTQVQDEQPQGPPLPGEDDEQPEQPDLITPPQLTKLHTALTNVGITDRDRGLDLYAAVIGHEVTSSKELTKAEASKVIDHLERLEDPRDDEPPAGEQPSLDDDPPY